MGGQPQNVSNNTLFGERLMSEHERLTILTALTKRSVGAPQISPTGLTGWAAMARTIRDIDEERIRDVKEDIDTLLVFVSTPW